MFSFLNHSKFVLSIIEKRVDLEKKCKKINFYCPDQKAKIFEYFSIRRYQFTFAWISRASFSYSLDFLPKKKASAYGSDGHANGLPNICW